MTSTASLLWEINKEVWAEKRHGLAEILKGLLCLLFFNRAREAAAGAGRLVRWVVT